MKYVKRLLSILLCLCIIVALIPSIVLTALAEDPWLWPTDGIYAMYRGYYSSHQGIDISAPLSTPVRATKAGTVIESKNNCPHVNYDPNPRCGGNPCNGGQGNYVKLRHDDGTYSRYLHLTQGTAIAVGTHVNQGDIVGYSGSSGDSSGPHLHFDCYNTSGVRFNNNPTDPRHSYTSTHDAGNLSYIYEAAATTPSNASVTTDKNIYALGETVTITPSASGADHFTMRVCYGTFGSDTTVFSDFNGFVGSKTYTPNRIGHYIVRISAIGGSGNFIDAECIFDVVAKISFNSLGGTYTSTCKSIGFDKINGSRGAGEMVVYLGNGNTVETNGIGFEVAVDRNGRVTSKRGYGDENQLTIPTDGFVLSAQLVASDDPKPVFVSAIKIGDYVAYDSSAMKVYHYKDYDEYLSQQKRLGLGSSYGNLPVPAKDGYYFNGWMDENGQTVDYNKTLLSTTLKAQWADDDTAPAAELTYNGHKYLRYEYNMTWDSAKSFCEAHGGHLVTITSADEQNTVENLLSDGRNLIYFTGCSDEADHGNWTWITGEPFSYDNWDPQLPEPSGSEQGFNYGGIVNKAIGGFKQFGEWLSNANYPDELNAYRICNYGFICEIDNICEHDYVPTVTDATCTEGGYTTYICSKCGDSYVDDYVPALGHDYQAVVTNPTCTEQGYTTHTCPRCGDSYTDSYTDALDHNWDDGVLSPAPSCTEAGVKTFTCQRCGTTKTEAVSATGHTPGESVKENEVAATCTTAGSYDMVIRCTTCNAILSSEHVDVPKAAHNYQATVTAPTCTEQGYTTHVCTACGDSYVDTYVDALGHDLIHHGAQAPTCTAAGWDAYDTCSRCDYTTYVEKAALGHNYHATVTAPTCTASGYTTYTCSRCGDSYVADEITALGHTPGTAVEENRVNPTCTTNGGFDTVTYCSVCNAELGRSHTDLAALGHLWDDGVINPAPNCTTDGVKTYTCQRCGETKTEAIAATGHTPGESMKENEVAATCTTSGGYDMVIRCTVCGAVLYTEHFESAALDHNYQAAVTAPTCTEGGYTTYTCSSCGDSYIADETAALGHTPGEPVKENNVAPTCTEVGGYDIVIYCTVCGAEISSEHIDVTALGHDWNEPEYVWADDYSTVTATRVCRNDETHIETETVQTTCEVTKEATVDEEGEITYTAVFENEAFETQTKIVATPKLEKPPVEFEDVVEGAYYADAVEWAVANGITNGTSPTSFSPNNECTRGQVVTFLWRAKGSPEPEAWKAGCRGDQRSPAGEQCSPLQTGTEPVGDGALDVPFTDVAETAYYYKAVLWAVENGITNGTGPTTFGPNNGCTRGQVVTFLWRTEGQPEPTSEENPFEDVTGGFYYKAVLWAVENKITAGVDATHFKPGNTCTRGQIVTFLYRDLG